jgi:hypothetical protein
MIKKIIPAALLLFAGFMSSCNDDLNLTPKDRISQDDYFKTASDLELFTNPLYNNLLDKEPYDDQSDLYIQQTLSNEILGGTYRTVPASGGGWTWTNLRRINTLLGNLDKCDDEAAVKKYSAVARFFRAFFYFEKVKRFGEVPWYDTELGSADEALYNPRDSREVVMTHMIEDIDYAIENLPRKAKESDNPYRATVGAALALKAQFCLYEGTYRKYRNLTVEGDHDYTYYLQQAADAAKQLIDLGDYKLYSTGAPSSDYLNLFAAENANTDEYILAICFSYDLAAYHNATAHTLVATQGRPGYTKKMMNMYLMKDGTAFTEQLGWQEMTYVQECQNRDPRMAQSVRGLGYHRIGKTEILPTDLSVSVTGYQPIKFVQDPTASGGQVDRNDRSTCDMPVYRYAEVLLNYAEAKAELGTLTQSDLDISINKIRDRVGMPHLDMTTANTNPDRYLSDSNTGFDNVTGTNKGVILEIRRERAVELAQEGFRFDDLVRWHYGKALNNGDNYSPLYGMYFPGPGSYDLTGDGQPNVVLYAQGTAKPTAGTGVLVYEIGTDLKLSEGTKGNVYYHMNIARADFNETRDYLYPIPINERSLNPNLTQNPGWEDGLEW